jgi:hypothetical protein
VRKHTDIPEQITCQRRATILLGQLLDLAAKRGLPAVDWTVVSVGSGLTGQFFTLPYTQRQADFRTWKAAITRASGKPPDADREHTRLSGETGMMASWAWLPMKLQPGTGEPGVKLILTAVIFPELSEGGLG